VRTQEVNTPALLEAAQTAASVQLAYAARGSSLAQAALAGVRRFEEFRHHPRNDVADPGTGSRFYYHAHRRDPHEHGHFHLFQYGMDQPGRFVHLAALSLDHRGTPTRWFTTNQWVTGEQWAPAPAVAEALHRFRVDTRGRMAPVARWLGAMVQLFLQPLQQLAHERDLCLAQASRGRTQDHVLEDRHIEVLATLPADLHQRIKQLGL
jgi:hypothetical protein